jgi:hypothetical protein
MSNQDTQIEQEIVRLAHEWIEAVGRRDGDALNRILADDFLKFRIYAEFVIANCVFKIQGLISGKEWGGEFLFTDVWIKRGNDWKAATRHTSQVFSMPGEN